MKLLRRRLKVAFLSSCLVGLGGCSEDNEAFMRAQARAAKGTIPGSRTAQAQTPEEYYEITPGLRGAGMHGGPVPDRGAGYPGAKTGDPRAKTGYPGAKK